MSNAKIIDLSQFKSIQISKKEHSEYQLYIDSLDKLQLLNEMVNFQHQRSEKGKLDATLMTQGLVLFRRLEQEAESEGLRSLAHSYRRHLEHELADYLKDPKGYDARATLDYDEDEF